tara:strand:- start:513 stop:794 length:282 start_codon:yes stop_codon:yes gene_type:complete
MTKLEAVKIANILMDNFKMPVARRGMFDSYVVTDKDDRDLLYIGAGGLGLYVDVETLEIIKKEKRKIFTIEEIESRSGGEYLSILPRDADFED